MNNQVNEKEIKELNDKFIAFLHTKGISAKFKLAYQDIKESAIKTHQESVANFNEVKAKSIEENKEFYEFLHTKGFKAKVKLVIENIKKGAKEAKDHPYGKVQVSQEDLNQKFNEFLKVNNLDNKYKVVIEEIK